MGLIFLFLSFIVNAEAFDWTPEILQSVQIDRVDGSKLLFKTPEGKPTPPPLTHNLENPEALYLLKSSSSVMPYVLFKANACKDCTSPESLYALSADGTRVWNFVYPGKVRDHETGATLLDSRAFYGKCARGKEDIYVVFQREKLKKRSGALQSSVLLAEPGPQYLKEELFSKLRGAPTLDFALKQTKKKECFEIAGKMRTTRPIPLPNNLGPPAKK